MAAGAHRVLPLSRQLGARDRQPTARQRKRRVQRHRLAALPLCTGNWCTRMRRSEPLAPARAVPYPSPRGSGHNSCSTTLVQHPPPPHLHSKTGRRGARRSAVMHKPCVSLWSNYTLSCGSAATLFLPGRITICFKYRSSSLLLTSIGGEIYSVEP